MSCWVVPAVAAEYWGVSVDAVWGRIRNQLVPHKTEDGFVFIDVDPWTPGPAGVQFHEPPQTYVSADSVVEPLYDFELPNAGALQLEAAEAEFLADDDELSHPRPDDHVEDAELPVSEDEESSAFSRLSWQDVRQRVGRTRKPPRIALESATRNRI